MIPIAIVRASWWQRFRNWFRPTVTYCETCSTPSTEWDEEISLSGWGTATACRHPERTP